VGRGLADCHEDDPDRVPVYCGYGERDAFSFLVNAEDDELAGLGVVRNMRCIHPYLVDLIGKGLGFFNSEQWFHSGICSIARG
jgi:hypothetical protein